MNVIGKRIDLIGKMVRGMKKAVIEVRLVDEAETESNETIEREIREESIIPWCREIEITES